MHKIFLSAHLDDVALSCGGLVAKASSAGERVLIATVCAALPPAGTPWSSADVLDLTLGFESTQAYVAARREEDRAAASVLGAEIEWGPSLDAIYRLPAVYHRHEALFRPAPQTDTLLHEATEFIHDLCRRFPGAEVYAPAGIGNHVDHRAVSAAAAATMVEICFKLCFYEDFPYVRATGVPPGLGKAEVVDVFAFVEQRVRAALCYRSQIPGLFGGDVATRAAIEEHMRAIGGERIWRSCLDGPEDGS